MQPVKQKHKVSTIAYKMPFEDFPKGKWVTFDIEVKWSEYAPGENKEVSKGKLDVYMSYSGKKQHIVDNQPVSIGRNDKDGYYFKFGIYRVGNSDVPVVYNLAGYSEKVIK